MESTSSRVATDASHALAFCTSSFCLERNIVHLCTFEYTIDNENVSCDILNLWGACYFLGPRAELFLLDLFGPPEPSTTSMNLLSNLATRVYNRLYIEIYGAEKKKQIALSSILGNLN